MKKISKNLEKKEIISKLYNKSKESKKDVYFTVAKTLEAPTRNEVKVNLLKLQKLSYVKDDDILIVPGKVLATGDLSKKVLIYAYSFSSAVKNKFKNIKTLNDFCEDKVDYKKIKIIK